MEIIKLNLIPNGVNPTCHAKQYDEGRVIRFELFDGLTPYTLQSGDTVTLNLRKPDNTIIETSVTATQGNKYVDLVTTEQMCACVGYNLGTFKIANGSVDIGTLNFIMAVERDVLADGIPSQSVIEDLDALVQEAVGDNYYTKTEVDDALDLKADKSTTYTKTQVDSALALKANTADVYTKSQTDAALTLKANSADVYTKTETDTALALKADKATTYTKTETDTLLNAKANSSDVYTKTQVDTALEGKADINGSYDDMTVGNAEQLVSSVFTKDKVPYNFRTSGGSADIGNREVDTVVGGTVAFNQLVQTTDTSVTVTSGHKYLSKINSVQTIATSNGTAISINDGTEDNVIDLTQMFGSTIADYIYSLEQGTAGAGVAFFRKLFPKSYYAYNAGELMSVKTSAHVTTGFNQFDEQMESGYINTAGNQDDATKMRSKNYIPVVPKMTYYFKSPALLTIYGYNANKEVILNVFGGYTTKQRQNGSFEIPDGVYYIRFYYTGTTYNHDICINLSWDGERDGEYEPYVKNTYPLDADLELRGIPKLDADNKLFYDGDEYSSDGNVLRKYGVVDLGTLDWVKTSGSSSPSGYLFRAVINAKPRARYEENNGICVPYVSNKDWWWSAQVENMGFMIDDLGRLYIRNDTYDNDEAAFKTAMSGIYFVYEKATPTTETADEYQNPQIVDDFGTEEYVDTRAVQIPVGHDTQYQVNLRAKLEMAPNSPDGNGDYIVRQTNGVNNYVPLVIPREVPDPPTEDGTYRLTVTVSGGVATYSWVTA